MASNVWNTGFRYSKLKHRAKAPLSRQYDSNVERVTDNLSETLMCIVSSFKKNGLDLSSERVSGIKYLLSLDLSCMNERMIYDKDFTNYSECNKAIIEYKKFLVIVLFLRRQITFIVPYVAVDKVWHHHIFDMNQYQMDCEDIWFCVIT
eukprot:533213_1